MQRCVIFAWNQKCALTIDWYTTENYINELATEKLLWSCPEWVAGRSEHEGSDRPSGEEIALSLIGWLGAAGAQISRFQEENSLVKWIGTERALCALCVSSDSCVFCPFLCLNVCRGESAHGCVQTQRRAQESGRLVWEKENSQVVSEEEKGGNSCGSTKIDWWMGGKK